MTKKPTFTKNMTFAEAIKINKGVVKILEKHGLHCIGCMGITQESLERGAINHGVDPVEFLKDLNRLTDNKK